MQCDFDTIGTRSVAADVETVLVIHDLLRAIGFERVHDPRQQPDGADRAAGAARSGRPRDGRAPRAGQAGQDRPGRRGRRDDRRGRRHRASRPASVLRLANISGSNDEVLAAARAAGGRQRNRAGRRRPARAKCSTASRPAGVPDDRLRLDVSIARGLDYYTGTVFETFLDALPGIGSVCSGGRYDNLAELYTSQELPGIGASLGLDRLLAAMEELGMIEQGRHAGPGVHPLLRQGPAARLPAPGRARCAPRASAWRSIPTRRSSASNSSTPTAAASAWP